MAAGGRRAKRDGMTIRQEEKALGTHLESCDEL